MKKRIFSLALLFCIGLALVCPLSAQAATALDTNAEASLTLHYQKGGTGYAGLKIGIYRVAEAKANGSFSLVEPFASWPIDIQGITRQSQWQYIAQTLNAYIVADGISPDREMRTDDAGTVCFTDLDTGLYFVREARAESDSGAYIFNQFLVYVPTPQPDGSYVYDVEANPKCTRFIPKQLYSVTKLWKDGGKQSLRTKSVRIDIFKDGVLYTSQTLSRDNGWLYSWYVAGDDDGKWTVAERSVPDGYTVSIRQNGSHFTVINTRKTSPGGPTTGDSPAPLLWIVLMGLSGVVLVALGVSARRRK